MVISHQSGLPSGCLSLSWSTTRVVSQNSGLPSWWSLIKVVFHQGGLSLSWSTTSVVFQHSCLPPGWSLISGLPAVVDFQHAGLPPGLHCTLLSFSPSTHAYPLTHPQLWIMTHSVRSSCASMIMSSACWANSLVLKPSSYFRTFRSSRSDFPFFSSSVYFCFTPWKKTKKNSSDALLPDFSVKSQFCPSDGKKFWLSTSLPVKCFNCDNEWPWPVYWQNCWKVVSHNHTVIQISRVH